jgi:hypothetical protein
MFRVTLTRVAGTCDLLGALKFLSLIVYAALCAALCGCGGESLDGSSSAAGTAPLPVTPPVLEAIHPSSAPSHLAFVLSLSGGPFERSDRVLVAGSEVASSLLAADSLTAMVPELARGSYQVRVERGEARSEALMLEIRNSKPTIAPLGKRVVGEDEWLEFKVEVSDGDGDALRVFASGLPPGAEWDEATLSFRFRPDFIQGGDSYEVMLTASDGTDEATHTFVIEISDTIAPPMPKSVSQSEVSTAWRIQLSQVTDDYLDSPGYAGRSFTARIVVPKKATAQNKYPVRVYLHSLGGAPYPYGNGDQFRIYPHDPMTSYWWGYAATLPGAKPSSGLVHNYTQRRVLHLLEYVLRNYPGADPERVYVVGASMGGAGAAALGVRYARHFAMVSATVGQMVPRNHRPSRIDQLSQLWGDPEDNLEDGFGEIAWDHGDVAAALDGDRESQQQFLFTRHGKDDSTIHFGAVSIASPLTGLSYYETLQDSAIGHYAVWDEGGHSSADPVLGSQWWGGHSFIVDEESYLRRNLPFIAFTTSSANDDPGDGTGNGKQSWSATAGYAGKYTVPGDTGWKGALAGVIGRYLRWDARAIVDDIDQLLIPLRAVVEPNATPAATGYPAKGDGYPGDVPILADATLRRAQRFLCLPGELIRYRFGALSGEVVADERGVVTVPQLPFTQRYTTLELSRATTDGAAK